MPESEHHGTGRIKSYVGFLQLIGSDGGDGHSGHSNSQHGSQGHHHPGHGDSEHCHPGHGDSGHHHHDHHGRGQRSGRTYEESIVIQMQLDLETINWEIFGERQGEMIHDFHIDRAHGASISQEDQDIADKLSDVSSRHAFIHTPDISFTLTPQILLQSILLTFTATFGNIHRDHFTADMTTSTKAKDYRHRNSNCSLSTDTYSQCTIS